MAAKSSIAFHGIHDVERLSTEESFTFLPKRWKTVLTRDIDFRFETHFHPYVARLIRKLVLGSVRGLEDADTAEPPLFDGQFFDAEHAPDPAVVDKPYPVKDLDFSPGGAYSVYNWELFFHVPLVVAIHLSKNQRFEEAERWFRYIMDPTDDSAGSTPERFWKVKPFRTTDVKRIEEILVNLATGDDPELQKSTIRCIEAWKDAPFRPHVIARYRQTPYMWKAVMAYLDNLIDWGDSLFRQDTGESINEATQLYILAANMLGPRPREVPRKGTTRPETYASLRSKLDELSNALVSFETAIPFDTAPLPAGAAEPEAAAILSSVGQTLYFCVPRNDKLLAYWDTVADRLFKIRNSLNLQGVFRQLPLFEPPIDPAMLARAAAAGLDVSAIATGAEGPLPLVRFHVVLQKALELCQEVKALGANLLSTMEKEDNEALSILRAKHERSLLALAESIKYGQWQEAIKAREGLEKTCENAVARYRYYERLLGKETKDIQIPDLEPLDTAGLLKLKLQAREPEVARREVPIDIDDSAAGVTGGKKLNREESAELARLQASRAKLDSAAVYDKIGGVMSIIPNFSANIQPFGVGASISFGGSNLAAMFSFMASFDKSGAEMATYQAGQSAKIGGYARREQEWAYQSTAAAGEITQIHKQIRAAQIREALAKREWENHKEQMKRAEEIEAFLTDEKTGKKTSKAFYSYQKREVRALYGRAFQLAFEVAKKAERALRHELGAPGLRYLGLQYMGGKEGLLAGEQLHADLKEMEQAHLDRNRRDYELTKNVSLRQLDPPALMALRATGRAVVTLPEALFDMDGPGHYFRRIKSVSVSMPCVAGPYTSVNVTLSLQKSWIRKSPLLDGTKPGLAEAYAMDGPEDSRFDSHFGSIESIVTSSAQNDAGMFETNLRDERYLPFEGAGAVSEWRISLPADVRQIDFDTITDVILHVRYTAREGGEQLKKGAVAYLEAGLDVGAAPGSLRIVSVRHELPVEWARLKNTVLSPAQPRAALSLTLAEEHYPLWSRGRLGALTSAELLIRTKVAGIEIHEKADGSGQKVVPAQDPEIGMLRAPLTGKLKPPHLGEHTLYLTETAMDEIWLIFTWA
jgi:hypothetical protein